MKWQLRTRAIPFPRRPLIMGIVNIQDDSFSGDGTQDGSEALEQAHRMSAAGADIIDVGAESARTNRKAISIQEEIDRFAPFIEQFHQINWRSWDAEQVQSPPILSINTWRPEVVEALLPLKVDLINDIGALPDDRNARLCAKYKTSLLIMHSVGRPKVSHLEEHYENIMETLAQFFEEKLKVAECAGLHRNQIVIDPGIDFAKQKRDNLIIYRDLERLTAFNCPVLLPVSRKTVIGEVLNINEPYERDAGTIACAVAGCLRGAHIFRVHHVPAVAQVVKVLHSLTTVENSR